jgi:hypothetical protein
MATVKISQLPILSHLSANNANTIFVAVDKTTNTTGQFSTTTLAGALFENNVLNVGTSQENINPNVIAQFISNTANYSQIWVQNINPKGSGDLVITSDNGDNSNNYIDLGIQGSGMVHSNDFDLANNDGYLYVQGKPGTPNGNLWVGTGQSNTDVVVFVGGTTQSNEAARFNKNGLVLKSKPITFADSTSQNTAAVTAAHSQNIYNQANSAYNFAIDVNTYAAAIYTEANTINDAVTVIQGVDTTQNTNITTANNAAQAAFVLANTNADSISVIQGVNTTQNTNITTANNHAWAAFDTANNALANTTGIFDGTLTITGDLHFDGSQSILATDDLYIGSSGAIQIQTNNGGTQRQYNFTTDGSLTVPNSITANAISLNDGGVYQYTTANNSTVTQATSKSTGVTCHGRTGQITTSNASLAKGDSVQFTVTNRQIVSAKDIVVVNIASGATSASYQICVDAVSIGSFGICITNTGTGPLAEALVINFAIIRVN